ncbi:MAG: dockerin type I domain-containing protein [Acidobacteriota bacterium]
MQKVLGSRLLCSTVLAVFTAASGVPAAWAGSCTADINGDGVVNVQDSVIVTNNLGTSDGRSDLNGNGFVGPIDVLIVEGNIFNSATACSCTADVDNSGAVDDRDLAQVRSDFGLAGCAADLDFNGIVEANDVNLVLDVILGLERDPRADLNGDGFVNSSDAVIAVETIGLVCSSDLNGDGAVDAIDASLLLAEWGPCP